MHFLDALRAQNASSGIMLCQYWILGRGYHP